MPGKKVTQYEAVQIFVDFLVTRPSDLEILNFTFPDRIHKRIQELVFKNNEGSITEDELEELAEYERLDGYGRLLKTKVARKQKEPSVHA